MAQKIKVNVDVNSEEVQFATDRTLTLTEQVRLLRKELQKVPEGTAEWTILQAKYNETKDALDRVNVKSKELFGTLGALPGPIGNISSELDNTIGTLKVFSGIKVSDIGTQFKELGKDLVGIGKGLLDLTGITKLYEATVNLTSKALIAMGVAEEEAAIAARGLSAALISTGIGALAVGIGLLIANWDKVTDALSGVTEEQKLYNQVAQDTIKQSGDTIVKNQLLVKQIKDNKIALDDQIPTLKEWNKQHADTNLQFKTFGELQAYIMSTGEDYIAYVKAKATAEAAYGALVAKNKELLLSQATDPAEFRKWYDWFINYQYITVAGDVRKEEALKQTNKEIQLLTDKWSAATTQVAEAAKKAKIKFVDDEQVKKGENAIDDAKKKLQEYYDLGKKIKAETSAQSTGDKTADARAKELADLKIDYEAKLKLAKVAGVDTVKVTESYEIQRGAVMKKYRDDALEKLKEYTATTESKAKEARQKELADAKIAYDKIANDVSLNNEEKLKAQEVYLKDIAAINKKYDDQDLKAQRDFTNKVLEIHAAAIKDDTDLKIAQREAKYTKDLEDLEADKLFIAKSEEEKAQLRKDLATAKENDIAKVKLDAKVKAGQDELDLLTAQQKTLVEGTQAYLDNSIAIENQAYQIKLANAKDNATKIQAVETEHEQNLKDIRLKAAIAEKQIQLDRLAVISSIGNSLAQLAGKNKALAIAAIAIEKAAAVGSIVVNTQIANLKAVAASPLTLGQPWVTINTVAGALAAAAAIASGVQAIQQINAVQIQGATSSGSSGAGSTPTPAFAAAQQASTPNIGKSAVSSEGKLGEIITSTATEQGTKPIQTYVVGSQVSNQQQLDRRVALAARMGGS